MAGLCLFTFIADLPIPSIAEAPQLIHNDDIARVVAE